MFFLVQECKHLPTAATVQESQDTTKPAKLTIIIHVFLFLYACTIQHHKVMMLEEGF